MSTQFFVDGELRITFFSGGKNKPMVQIDQPGAEKYIQIPLELFFHVLTDPELAIETSLRFAGVR